MKLRILSVCAPFALLLATQASQAGATQGKPGVEVAAQADAGAALPATPPCIHVWAEARMRAYGYDHIVHIQNACTKDASCSVASDVNPVAVEVKVPKGTEVETNTWLGSPAREFVPRVTCVLP
jgi:hypothetical protein